MDLPSPHGPTYKSQCYCYIMQSSEGKICWRKLALGHLPPKISLATCSPIPTAAALVLALSKCALLWLCYVYCALVCAATL